MKVPFCDLSARNLPHAEGLVSKMKATLFGGTYILGDQVEAFEAEFAAACRSQYAVGAASGMDALTLALLAVGVGPAHDVIVPAATCVATWMAVTRTGARVVPVDVDPATWCIDAAQIAGAVTARTRAIVPVHLYGREADLPAVFAVAENNGLQVVVDACQGHGLPAVGDATAFSFYPTKNLGALGDGGAVVTAFEGIAGRVRSLRNYGSLTKNVHVEVGLNSRLDELQAGLLRVKLPSLAADNRHRAAVAAVYRERLAGRVALQDAGGPHVWHQFVIGVDAPGALVKQLEQAGIGTARHYPVPPHLMPAYRRLGFAEGAFPAAERLSATCVSLPIGPEVSLQAAEAVAAAVVAAL